MTVTSQWPAAPSSRWPRARLKDHAELINGFPFDSSGFNGTVGVPVIRIRDLLPGNTETLFDGPVPEEVMVRNGDLLIGMDGDFNAVTWRSGPAALNQRLCLLRARSTLDQRFLAYAVPRVLKAINDVTYSTTVKHLSSVDLMNERIPLPAIGEQLGIADFLDAETARIDALIDKKRRMIELIELRAKTLIGHATTKGIDPTTPTRDSGVQWIGRVPRDWQVVKIRHLSSVRRGASPRPIDDPIYFDDEGEYAWVRISDVTAAGRYLFETEQRLSELGSSKSVRLQPGALFVSIAATVGKPVITQIKCCIHDGFVHFDRLRLNRDFLYYILVSGLPYGGLGKLGTQLNLNTDTIGDVRVPVPDASEQQRIVSYLDDQLARQERLTRAIRLQIDLLAEHRQALITAAVTDQLGLAKAAA